MTLPNDLYLNGGHYEKAQRPMGEIRTIRKWGDPIMVRYGFDVNQAGTTNFQAVKTWNDGNFQFGAVTNFLRIPKDEMFKVRDLQFTETLPHGTFTPDRKMGWLCQWRGKIYMYDNPEDHWAVAPYTRWGTVSLGGNKVLVERYEVINVSVNGESKKPREMARLVGFNKSDWNLPLSVLLELGLVHRCYCAYFPNNGFGDTPKGIIYSPFFGPNRYDFVGPSDQQPTALYLLNEWLED